MRKTLFTTFKNSNQTDADKNSPGLKLPVKKEEKKCSSFVMTFTTISPKNQFKKLAAQAKDKELNANTCSWIRAYQNVKRHKLFQLKFTSSVSLHGAY